jgi:hypothetical protein
MAAFYEDEDLIRTKLAEAVFLAEQAADQQAKLGELAQHYSKLADEYAEKAKAAYEAGGEWGCDLDHAWTLLMLSGRISDERAKLILMRWPPEGSA